jgi:hypothetical protein
MAGEDKKTASIFQKLANIQQAIKVTKDRNNDFAGFKYRSAEDILEAVKPLLKKESALIVLDDDLVEMNGSVYVKGTATLLDLDNIGPGVSVDAYAREEVSRPKMSEGQLTGAASSYARKYALSGLLLLDDNKDPDSQENSAKKATTTAPASKPVTAKEPKLDNGADDDPLHPVKKDQLARSMRALEMSDDDIHLLVTKVLGKSTVDTWGDYRKVLAEL